MHQAQDQPLYQASTPAPRRLITRNPYMQHLLEELGRLAEARATVLIQGESGTGKEVFAHAVHQRSPRSRGSFVRLNCAALPEGVLESELFGHERGAFTGAVRQHAGRFEMAHRGTLFLDEIGAAPPQVQVRLLRVLQEQEFERIGGTQTIRVDVRVIAATNVELKREVGLGRFREDLFYRLNVLPVQLPPLRERREDIPLLVEHFIQVAACKNRRPLSGIEAVAVAQLQDYPWPGNIRQLENTIERMVVLARRPCLGIADLPAEILRWREEEDLEELGACSYREAKDLFERRFLCAALRRHQGVISQVAEAIEMSRKNLYTKMDHLKIDYARFRPWGAHSEEA
ncbi:MAG: sigma-54-dependent Fis family transcriptional regulator [Candidatus Latescibacteria bacterium]|nr:sigma-54-dependent Fis family transcriptional regulator [Candidatus Latescibacterota bacterium]